MSRLLISWIQGGKGVEEGREVESRGVGAHQGDTHCEEESYPTDRQEGEAAQGGSPLSLKRRGMSCC